MGGFATSGSTAGFWNPTTPGNIVSDPNDGSLSETISNKTGCNFATNVNNTYEDFAQIRTTTSMVCPLEYLPNFPNNGGASSNGVVNAWYLQV